VEEPFLSAFEYKCFYDVRQTEIHTADPLVLELSAFEVELHIEKLKNHKSPGMDQIPCGIDSSRGQDSSLGYILINSVWNKEELIV
jgi:hypothetical protein